MDVQPYDIVFCGLGIGACLLLRELDRRQLLEGKKICILEPDPKLQNDKTLCFWAEPHSSIVSENEDIIVRSWKKAEVPPFGRQSLDPFRYYQIDNQTLYERIREIIHRCNMDMIQTEVSTLKCIDKTVTIATSNMKYYARLVYDSRPPDRKDRKDQILLQSFLGQRVRVSQPLFDSETFSLMDFSVPQGEHTQFVYVLPEDSHTALVEFTRFGLQKIENKTEK